MDKDPPKKRSGGHKRMMISARKKPIVRATTADDLPEVSMLLAKSFGGSPDIPFVTCEVMQWKYLQSRRDWLEPRSYVLTKDGSIVAHAGIWPVTSGVGMNLARGVHMIDWAAARETPGAGLILARRLTEHFDLMYSIGGSASTRRLLPAIGFIEVTRMWRAARPLRPFGQIHVHQSRNLKLAPRLVRNWLWSVLPRKVSTAGWTAEEICSTQASQFREWQRTSTQRRSSHLTAFLDYLLRCPATVFRIYRVRNQEGTQGNFLLSIVRGQARLAGVWLKRSHFEVWQKVYALAQEVALEWYDTREIIAVGTCDVAAEAAVGSGLRLLTSVPVYVRSRTGEPLLARNCQLQLCDNDGAFLDLGRSDYWT